MAERIVRQLIDDLDQSEIADGEGGPVEFAFRGTTYKIDLSDANAAKLEMARTSFIASATRVSGPSVKSAPATQGTGRRSSKRAKSASTKHATSEIRTWAADNGHEVKGRGRVPAGVVEAYQSAHGANGRARPKR